MNKITIQQAYEWVKTGHWTLTQFRAWVQQIHDEGVVLGKLIVENEE